MPDNTWQSRMRARPRPEPALTLARSLWTMRRPPNKSVTAAIYEVETGRELRVSYGGEPNLLDSLLSREGDGPLEHRASELRAILEKQGWSLDVPSIAPAGDGRAIRVGDELRIEVSGDQLAREIEKLREPGE